MPVVTVNNRRETQYIARLNNLRKINNLKFTKADKGGCFVVLNQTDYERMIQTHLQDSKTYKLLPESIDNEIYNKISDLVLAFEYCFARDELTYLLDHEFSASTFYILPKIHKSKIIAQACSKVYNNYLHIDSIPFDLPSRPIVSNINSPTSRLSHFIDSLLKPLVLLVPSYIKNSFDFLEKLPKEMPDNTSFLSLDVTSLYTVIPHDFGLEAVQYWCTKYNNKLDANFPIMFILDALKLILTFNTFIHFKKCYQQLVGTAMGTQVAPSYAHLVMAYLELKMQDKCMTIFGRENTISIFSHYYRYLDDIFIVWPLTQEFAKLFVESFNSVHESFKFTYGLSSHEIHFLDVTLFKSNKKIMSDIYYKPTDSFQYLHFYSHHPSHIKRNIPYCLAYRITRIVNSDDLRKQRLTELAHKLYALKYPKRLVQDALNKALYPKNIVTQDSQEENIINMSLTYSYFNMTFYQQVFCPSISHINNSIFQDNPFKVRRGIRQPPNLLRMLNCRQIFSVRRCNMPRCKTCDIIIESRKGY